MLGCRAAVWCCGPTGVAGVACAVRRAGLLGARVVGGLSACCLLPDRSPAAACLPARAASFARRVASLLGQAPPTRVGTAARPRFGPTGPASALAHIAAELPNFACNSPTTLSNYEFTTLELQRFQTLLKLHPIELHASFLRGGRMGAAGGAAGAREPGVWLSETAVAFARAGRASVETAAAFAGEKWVYFVRFSVASVLSVSMVAVEGRAVVMAVSRWPASAAAVVSLVSKPPCHCALCAKKFALRHRVAVKARKSSPCMPKTAEKRCFQARWASFFAEMPLLGRAGRVISRKSRWRGCAGRILSRVRTEMERGGYNLGQNNQANVC